MPGVLVAPTEARANVFTSFFGTKASASSEELRGTDTTNQNSQTLGLLEPGAVFLPGEKSVKKKDKKTETQGEVNKNTDVYISENTLMPVVGPLGVYDGEEEFSLDESDMSVYVVHKGDTLAKIAEMFDVSIDTILSVNELKKGAKVSEGDILFILPFSGVEHKVSKGETLQGIAKKYKVDVDEIILYNHLETSKIAIGDKLIIPGAEMLKEEAPAKPKPNTGKSSSVASAKSTYTFVDTSGYFINPVPGSRWVRGLSRTHKGVDLAAPTGTPILAAAGGRVIFSKYGWNGRYGNMVIIQHPNGTKTLYAHMSKIKSTQGEEVRQGEVIGYVGSTGRSTGPHLHIEVLGGKNPF